MDASGPQPSSTSGSRSRRRPLVAIGVAALTIVVVALAGYLTIGALAYRELSALQPQAGGRWEDQTPANFEARIDATSGAPWLDASPYRFDDFTEVAFPSRDARPLTIRAWYAPTAAGVDAPVVVVVHGKGASHRDPVVLLPAGMLHRAGFAVLMPDLRDHGDSDVEDMRWAGGAEEYLDVLGAVDWLVAQGYEPDRIGLMGSSLGAATVTIAMGEEPAVAATWADSAYSDFDVAAEEYTENGGYPGWVTGAGVFVGRIMSGDPLGDHDPARALARLSGRPYAIVHCDADRTVYVHHADDNAAIAAAAGTEVTPWILPGCGHVDAMFVAPDEYERRLLAFFTDALGAPIAR
ncbi:MAG TPA: alpha/beta fold hydrolase [Candidatus Limnocylindrales bacterium]|nr:alpha/beta fold hydrolase [Candidatus Limnocylindrales bacterium]